MKATTNLAKLLLVISVGSYLVGCGKGIQVNPLETPEQIAEAVQNIDTMELKASVNQSKLAMDQAQAALASIIDADGSFNWDIFLGGVDFDKVSADTKLCLAAAFPNTNIALRIFTAPKDIAKGLKCILDDVVIAAGIANTNLNFALEALTKAQANTTVGSAEYQGLQLMIDQITPLKVSYKLALSAMASQLTIVTTALSQLPTLATGAIPVPILSLLVGYGVGNFVQPLIFEIMSFQARIEAL